MNGKLKTLNKMPSAAEQKVRQVMSLQEQIEGLQSSMRQEMQSQFKKQFENLEKMHKRELRRSEERLSSELAQWIAVFWIGILLCIIILACAILQRL